MSKELCKDLEKALTGAVSKVISKFADPGSDSDDQAPRVPRRPPSKKR